MKPLFLVLAPILAVTALTNCGRVQYLAAVKPVTYPLADSLRNIAPDDTNILRIVRPYRAQLEAEMNTVIATIAETMTKAKPESTLGNWVADAIWQQGSILFGAPLDLAITNSGGIRIPALQAGTLTRGKIFELMPFDNALVVLEMNGALLQQFLDHTAKGDGWPISRSLRFVIENETATNVRINGEPISPTKVYTVLTSDFIANGGDKCFFLKELPQKRIAIFRDVLLQYAESENCKGNLLSATIDGRITKKE